MIANVNGNKKLHTGGYHIEITKKLNSASYYCHHFRDYRRCDLA